MSLRWISMGLMVLCTAACVEPVNTEQKESEAGAKSEALIDNLPISDRDLLLEPLESALDDLRKGIEDSEVYFASEREINHDGYSGTMRYKLDGADTVMVDFEWSNGTGSTERNRYFFDKKGQLFYSEHKVVDALGLSGVKTSSWELKFYYDGETLLSSYGRQGFNEKPNEEWTPVCLTSEEENFWLSRRALVNAAE